MKRGIITISENGVVDITSKSIWMTQFEIADLFGVFAYDIRKIVKTIYREGVLLEYDTMQNIKANGKTSMDVYNIAMITAIAFRIFSKEAAVFRQYVTSLIYKKDDCRMVFFTYEKRKGSTIFN